MKAKEFKINVHVEPLDGYHMSDYDFEVELYVYSNKSVTLSKNDGLVVKVDEDNYKVCITSEATAKLGRGAVLMNFTAYIPDVDFPDGFRTERVEGICTSVTI